MCGIAGRVDFGRQADSESRKSIVKAMANALEHRGPDHTDFGHVGGATFGFQRLSLLALENGNQPFISDDGQVMLIVNGEIYNHKKLRSDLEKKCRFHTFSDCEVLLHGYLNEGMAYLRRLNGMYAFALYDNRVHRLFLGRDRFGIKPLAYAVSQNRVAFASEVKALFTDPSTPRELDWVNALGNPGLNLDSVLETSPPTSWFKGIDIVPAAHFIEIDCYSGTTVKHRYWDPDAGADLSHHSSDEIVDLYRNALSESVENCLTADVEVGLFLSGGIDSAAVAAFAKGKSIATFTALTGSTYVNGDAEYSHRTAKACGFKNHQILFDRDRIPSPDEWRTILWALETPQASPEHFYKFELHRFARHTYPNLKAMLLGQASDEFNGGYSKKLSGGAGYDAYLETVSELQLNTGLRAAPRLAPWFKEGHGTLLRRTVLPHMDMDPYRQYLQWKLHDIDQYNNWHEDRTAAANSIEARVPFLDHRVVEITNGIPRELHSELFWDKRILRKALVGLLPPDILERPKVSFFYDDPGYNNQQTFIRMIKQNSGELLSDALSSPGAAYWLEPDAVASTVDLLDSDPSHSSMEYLLGVINLGLLDNLIDSLPRTFESRDLVDSPIELSVDDWDESSNAIRDAVVFVDTVSDNSVIGRREDIKLLMDLETDSSALVLAVDGELAFSFEDEDSEVWRRIFLALQESNSISELASCLDLEVERVRRYVVEGIEAGVLEVLSE